MSTVGNELMDEIDITLLMYNLGEKDGELASC